MSNVSRPIQILLAAVVVFAVAWFLVLKPGDEDTVEPQAQAPGVTGLTNAVNQAKGAAKTSEERSAKAENATGTEPATTPTPAKTTKTTTSTTVKKTTTPAPSGTGAVTPAGPPVNDPARSSGDPADGLLDKLTGDRVVILLFTGDGADDRKAIRAVRAADRELDGVIVRVTQLRNVGKYATITDKLGINQAPSTIIIGSDKVAQVLTGIIDAKVVKQYVGDARRRAAKSK
ncbi:MAG: hypothetical protein V9E83_14845 [Baekduia sp.]